MNTGQYLKIEDNHLGSFEQRLSSVLNPINPNPEFVHRLQRRLVTPPLVAIESHSRPFWLVLILAAGLVLGVLFYWLFGQSRKRI